MIEPYQFKPDDAYRFGKDQGIPVRRRGDELQFAICPYCHSTKDKGTFSINLKTGQFKCLRASCGAKGNMLTLHRDFGFDLGTELAEYERPRSKYRTFKKPEKPIEPNETAVSYLEKRGIPADIVRRYEIKAQTDNRIAFPFFNEDGELEFIKYRYIDKDKTKDGRKEDCEPGCRAILFGMKQCEDFDTLIITEGQIDSLSVAAAGFKNAVSVPTGKNGMTWVPHCWDWVRKFKTIIVFGDHERDEITLLSDIRSRFGDKCQIKHVRVEDYQGCKDANELLQKHGAEAIRNAVNNAELETPNYIKRLSSVRTDRNEKETLPTEICDVDECLNGGLPFGYIHILTGKRGEGKSTFASMIAKSALEHGYNTFIYSGEMTTEDTRNTLDRQIAGRDKIKEQTRGHKTTYTIYSEPLKQMAAWYYDRAYIFDTEAVLIDDTPDLIEVVHGAISQCGCRVVIIDNLMTAVDLCPRYSGKDKTERQELICKELARTAQMFNALILIVAHKKKQDGTQDENDMVLGASEITNLAGMILSYGKGSGKDNNLAPDQRRIKVTKNRIDGSVDYTGVIANFDPVSKRIYGNHLADSRDDIEVDDPNRISECFKGNDSEFISIDEIEDIPF